MGHFGTDWETPPFRIYPHLVLLKMFDRCFLKGILGGSLKIASEDTKQNPRQNYDLEDLNYWPDVLQGLKVGKSQSTEDVTRK